MGAVLHVFQPPEAGVPRYVADITRRQARMGWTVHVAGPDVTEDRFDTPGVHFHAWNAARWPGATLPAEIARLRRIVARTRPEIVHLHSSKAGVAGRVALRGARPTIFQPHAWSMAAVTGVAHTAALAWERFAARWTTTIVCVSRDERQTGLASAIKAPWSLIPNGVDADVLLPVTPDERASARARLGIGGSPVAIAVGRLSRQKGHDLLLHAWPMVASEVASARLFVIGDGPERKTLEHTVAAVGARDTIRLVGHSDDVASWLAVADVAVFPSRWEGMSLAMLEAMARGRSVVATNVAGAREAVGSDRGAVVPVGDERALAEAIVRRLDDRSLAEREGAAGRRAVEATFNLDRVVASLDALYRKLLTRSP